MDDFWGPFVFGFIWLVPAIGAAMLLRRPTSRPLSLRSGIARVLTWLLVIFVAMIFVMDLPYSLGFCRGGFDDPVTCRGLPVVLGEVTSALTLLAVLASIVAVPVLVAGVLIAELVKRWR